MKKILITAVFMTGLFILLNLTVEAQMKTVVSYTGSVFNAITRDPIRIDYKLLDQTGKAIRRGKTNAAQNGYYFVTGLKPGENYKIVFEGDDNYLKAEFDIVIPVTDKYEEFSKDYMVTPKYKGMELPQRVAVFELNKSKLRGGADFFLEDFMQTIKDNPNVKFTISAYPDNNNDQSANESLTKARCESLKDYFVVKGIASDKITIKTNNTTDPKNPPPTEKRAKGKRYIGSVYYVISEF